MTRTALRTKTPAQVLRTGRNRFLPALGAAERLESRQLLSVAPPVAGPTFQIADTVTNDWYSPSNGQLWGMAKIGAPKAWDTQRGSPKVVVADIDTGIDYRHADLYENIWINQAEIPADIKSQLSDVDGDGLITFWDLNDPSNQGVGKITDQNGNGAIDGKDILAPRKSDGTGGWADGISEDGDLAHVDDLIGWNFVANTNDPFDDNGHGTHTSGTIGALGNNNLDVVGVNWQVQLMAVKVLDANGSGSDTTIAAGIRYSADHGARVSNNSYGGSGGSTGDAMYQAIQYAGSKNQVFVAAAGNSGLNNDTSRSRSYPASYSLDNIIAVAATDQKDGRPTWSNYGKTTVDLGAPGVSIWSTWADPNNGVVQESGTSMATPHVAGAAALLLAKNPTLAATGTNGVKGLILNNVDQVSSMINRTVSGGRLDVAKALAATPAPPAVTVAAPATTLTVATTTTPGGGKASPAVASAASLAAPEDAPGVPLSAPQSLIVFTPASDPFRLSIGLPVTDDGSALTGASTFAWPAGTRPGKDGVRRPGSLLS